MTDEEREKEVEWHNYCRWAIGPLMTREQWEADRELAMTDWPAWCRKHGVG